MSFGFKGKTENQEIHKAESKTPLKDASWVSSLWARFSGIWSNTKKVDTDKLPWWRLGFAADTNHTHTIRIDVSPAASVTFLLLGGMFCMRSSGSRGLPYRWIRAPEPVSAHLRVRRSFAMPSFIQAQPSPVQRFVLAPLRFFWQGLAVFSVSICSVAAYCAWQEITTVDKEVFEIRGSKVASLHANVKTIKDTLDNLSDRSRDLKKQIGTVELGGVRWTVEVEYRNNRTLVGFYLTHLSGSKDQIPFVMRIFGISGSVERCLATEQHGSDWVILPFFAADGKGTTVSVADLEDISDVRIEFQALGPASKHRFAL